MSAHHPAETTLASYAAGALPHGLSLIVATHCSTCPACRDKVAIYEELGGALLDEAQNAAVRPDLLRLTMARLGEAEPALSQENSTAPDWHDLPNPLGALLPGDPADIRWWPAGPGIRIAALGGTGPEDGIRLLKIAPGKAVPEHGHGGHELSLVIQGAFSDHAGTFGPGDVADLDQDARHQPEALSGEDCICIIATDAPLEFSGLAPRLLQPIIGI